MRFYDIFWLLFSVSLAIGLINSMGVFTVNHMTVPSDATFEIADVNGTLNETMSDDASMSLTSFYSGFNLLKDIVFNMFVVYGAMVSIWHVPPQLAVVLQAIVAISWLIFFIQFITGRYFQGTES